MIPRTETKFQPTDWQQQISLAITNPMELLKHLQLQASQLPYAISTAQKFRTRVPFAFISRMQPGDPHDPLLLQVLPQADEHNQHPLYLSDPVGDHLSEPIPGLLHKYHGRVLLITTGACAIHCRYCFRRHFPYSDSSSTGNRLETALDYLRQQPDISEVILSGGDPLSLSDSKLDSLISRLEEIPHIQRLRLHTRLPVIIPDRITDRLCKKLYSSRLKTIVVLHINHHREIDTTVKDACKRLQNSNCTLLNQTVLLKGINNDVTLLKQLSETLFDCGVMPYYLHQLDKVQGAAHFEVSDHHALTMMDELRACLPGYMVPRLVREVSGKAYKLPL